MSNNPDWKSKTQGILDANNHRHAKLSKDVGYRTREARAGAVFLFMNLLRSLGYEPDPYNLGGTHIEQAIWYWTCDPRIAARCEKEGVPMREEPISAAYLQFLASVLRTFSGWIGKPGMVLPLDRYVADPALLRRRYAASRDKSWSAKVLDIPLLIQQVCMLDIYVGIQLELMFRFGLRKKEAVSLRPHLQLIPASMVPGYELVAESYLMLVLQEGTKGGRLRFVPIDTHAKRGVLMRAQALVSHTRAHMGRPGHSLDQALRRFDYIMEKLGITMADLEITAHGLRHEYANDLYVELTGEHSPVRGGIPSDLRRHLAACLEIAKQLGHGRVQIAGAYLGPLLQAARRKGSPEGADAKPVIE